MKKLPLKYKNRLSQIIEINQWNN